MPLYKNGNKELLHIHIPKTGGTTIMHDLKDRKVDVSYITKASHKQYGGVPPQHMDITYIKKFFNLNEITSFAVVRHPWQRTVSEFVWRKRINEFNSLNKWVKDILTNIRHELYQNHFLPQKMFIDNNVKIFSYDNWVGICEYVGEQLGIEQFVTKYWKQKRIDYKLPTIDLLDNDTKSVWDSLYKEDLELYHSL